MTSEPIDPAEVARQLRELVKSVPATTAPERRTARRIEGAAVGLESVAEDAETPVS